MNYIDIESDAYSIKMELMEMEDRLPSFKLEIRLQFHSVSKELVYSSKGFWFECRVWDNFIDQLKRDKPGISTLNDMSEQFKLNLTHEDNVKLLISVKDNFVGKVVNISYSLILNDDEFGQLKRSFFDFPKWW